MCIKRQRLRKRETETDRQTEEKTETETDKLKRRQPFISLSLRSQEMGKHRTLLFQTFRSLMVKENNLIQQIKADQNNPAFTNGARVFKQQNQALYGRRRRSKTLLLQCGIFQFLSSLCFQCNFLQMHIV